MSLNAGNIANSRDVLSVHLAEIFRALLEAAAIADVDLREAAQNNVYKINSRWPTNREHTPLFDEDFHEWEQLPRKIEMHIVETQVGGRTCVIQLCNGVEIGSRLTDNKIVEDDYRFHDVFHLANAAILGWSPCLRSLFKVKRKSRPEVDETQDGARAILIEEGLSTLVFHHALRLGYFASIQTLDYSLLKTVQDFVTGFEVDQCPLWQWEQAILDGFEVFRKLRTHRRGVVTADLSNVRSPSKHIQMTVNEFVDELRSISLPNVFNPYRDVCISGSPGICNSPMSEFDFFLKAMLRSESRSLWLGRDLGYRGGRRTGIALTDEFHLDVLQDTFGVFGIVKATLDANATKERTATEVWKLLESDSNSPFCYGMRFRSIPSIRVT